jgi:hypothetical protein
MKGLPDKRNPASAVVASMVGLYRWAGLQRLKGNVSCSAYALAFAFKCSDGSPIDHDKPQAQAARASIVAPALRSDAALPRAATGTTDEGLKVHSFQTLLRDLATIVKNRIQPKDKNILPSICLPCQPGSSSRHSTPSESPSGSIN